MLKTASGARGPLTGEVCSWLRYAPASHGLQVANVGSAPTFERGGSTSVIDVTFCRDLNVTDWSVLDVVSLSDHRYVEFSVSDSVVGPTPVALSPECDNISTG